MDKNEKFLQNVQNQFSQTRMGIKFLHILKKNIF